MASISEIIKRQYEIYNKEEFLNNNVDLIKDFACRFVLFLDDEQYDENLNLNEVINLFEEHYSDTTNISGNGINL